MNGQQRLVLWLFAMGCLLALCLGAMYAPLPK